MWLLALVLSSVLALFSTAVMSYIAMATPIGPWIASTLVLIAMLVYKIARQHTKVSEQIALVTSAGSVGGILATALGFSFPTLYFIDKELFGTWMASPWYFSVVISVFSCVAGWFGFWIANMIEHKFIVEEQLPFPIGQLVYKMIAAQNQVRKAWELVAGFVSTMFFCLLQDGIVVRGITYVHGFIPKTIGLNNPINFSVFTFPRIPFDVWPMLWAIGFVTGHVIAIPLAVGALVKMIVVEPINRAFFIDIKPMEFILAFCSGMVLAGALQGLIDTPKVLWKAVKKMFGSRKQAQAERSSIMNMVRANREYIVEALFMFTALIAFLTYFEFSWLTQLYLIVFSFICTYQMVLIGGKIGLAQLGRFATFVMVPAMFLFNLNMVQLVMIATFVEVCGGVATDILFGRKIAHMAHIPRKKMQRYQYLGLVVSALAVGIIFWLLINHFGLGSTDLFAGRAQARKLLIDVKSFDYYVLIIGLVFGFLLKVINLSPMLVLGGLLMPLNISIGLMLGGLCTLLTKDKEEWYPLWSGVFAANSVWMLVKAIL